MRYFLLIVMLVGDFTACFAQKEANNWAFGLNAGINFNTNPPAFFHTSVNTSEGCATISNGDGQLLFYTDGIKTWNRNHQQMPNGYGMLGHPSSTQSALIVPNPGNDSLYYIFTSDAIECGLLAINYDCGYNGIHYSVVNMKRNNGLGDVVVKNKPLAPFRMHEKITAVKHANNRDYWIITHKWNTNEFYEFLVTPAGVDSVERIVAVGSKVTRHESRIGCLKASSNGKKIAVAYWKDFYELFNFDNETGAITHPIRIAPEKMNDELGPYGVEFSCNANYLYLSEGIAWYGFFSGVNPVKYKIYQYDISIHDSAAIRNSKYVVDSLVSGDTSVWAMQMGPDDKIYVTFEKNYLGAITKPGMPGAACGYVRNYLVFPAGMRPRRGLPNINPAFLNPNPFFTTQHDCSSNQLAFFIGGINQVDSLQWNFGDPASGNSNYSNLAAPIHNFSNSGFYQVSLILYRKCHTDTLKNTISAGNQHSLLGPDTTLCAGNSFILYANIPGAAYEWQNGSGTDSFIVTSAGTYWLKIILGDCILTDTIHIRYSDYPALNLEPLISICSNNLPVSIGQDIIGAAYVWNTGDTTPVITIYNDGWYWVDCSNGICTKRDSIQIVKKTVPYISFGNDTTLCDGKTLVLDVSDPSLACMWSNGSTASFLPVNGPGSYSCTVTNADGCVYSDTIVVNYQSVPVLNLGRDTVLCEGTVLVIDLTGSGEEYLWQDQSSQPVYTVIKPGKYYATVREGICYNSDTILVQYLLMPRPALGKDTIVCEGEFIILDPNVSGDSYLWQDGSNLPVLRVNEAGLYTVTVYNRCGSGYGKVNVRKEVCDLTVPTAFVPGGKNQTLCVLRAYNLSFFEFEVFNRWGQRVFETKDIHACWDGRFHGIDQATAVYAWQVIYRVNGTDKKKIKKGTVTLIR